MLSSGLRKVMKALLILLAAAWITTGANATSEGERAPGLADKRFVSTYLYAAVRPATATDDAFAGRPIGALFSLGDALRAEVRDGGVHVATSLLERLLAIHHARAGPLAELRNGLGRDRGRHRDAYMFKVS